MIRINLAHKKQASYVGGKASAGKTTSFQAFQSLSEGGLAGLLPVFGKILLPLVLCAIGYFGFDYYVQQKTEEMAQEAANIVKEKERIQVELRRISGFESVRADLEKNERILRTKIETIEKLLRGRDHALKTMVTLSESLPKEVWLVEVSSTDTAYTIRGGATDIGYISDVMSRLGQSIYFKEVTLRNSSTDVNGKIATFELNARRD